MTDEIGLVSGDVEGWVPRPEQKTSLDSGIVQLRWRVIGPRSHRRMLQRSGTPGTPIALLRDRAV